MKYSLASYILSIQSNDSNLRTLFQNVSIGGEGSALDNIKASYDNGDLWSTTGFSTGAWVHNKNLSRTGTVEVSISQLSDKVAKFKQMCGVFYNGEYDGFTLSLADNLGNKVFTAVDCYLTKIPDQEFGKEAAMQTWTFTCGEITFD